MTQKTGYVSSSWAQFWLGPVSIKECSSIGIFYWYHIDLFESPY